MAAAFLVIKSAGMLFRVFLAGRLGAEGLGLYQLVMSVYLVFAATVSSGVCLCASRLFTELSARGKPAQARYAAEYCMKLSFFIGLAGGALMLSCADAAASYLLHDERAAPSLRLLAPGLPFLAVSAAVRGYFLARRSTLQPSGQQLIEQLIETGGFALVMALFRPRDITQTCCIAAASAASAELASFVYSLLCYRADARKTGAGREKVFRIGRTALPVLLPVSANACIRSGLSAAENALIPSGLKKHGLDVSEALSQYGITSGMVMPVITFPSVLILPFSTLMITEAADARARGDTAAIKRMTEKAVSAVLRYSLPVTVMLIFFADPLCMALFGSASAGKYLAVLAPVVPFMYLDCAADAILKGLDEQLSYFVFNTIDSVIRVALTFILVPVYGITGASAVIIISELLNTAMSLFRLVQVTSFRLSIVRSVLLPAVTAAAACLFAQALPLTGLSTADLIIRLSLCCIFCAGAYMLSLKRGGYGILRRRA